MEPKGTIAGTQGIVGELEAALAAARATIERHEAAAREHSDERAGLCAELARVTAARDTAQAVAANIERERHALREAYDRDVARLRDDLTEARLSYADRQNRYVAGVLADAVQMREELRDIAEVIGTPYMGSAGLAGGVRLALDGLRAELAEARAAVATHEADLAAAAGELLVPLPTPGTVTAKLLAANVLMRRRNERFNALVNCARRESEARAAWLASLPAGACTSPPSQALLDAEAATRAALRAIEACS